MNTALISLALLLDMESATVERLLPWQEGRNQDLLQKWKYTVQDIYDTTTNSRNHATDSFISALARARVLSALLEDTTSDRGLVTLNMLRSLKKDGNAAVCAGIQYFNSVHIMFDPRRVQPLQIYTTLLQQASAVDSRIPLIEGLSALLSLRRQSDGTAGVPGTTAPIILEDEYLPLVSWEEQEPTSDPRTVNATLKLRGALLAHACETCSLEDSRLELKLEIWARMLKLAGESRSVSRVQDLGILKMTHGTNRISPLDWPPLLLSTTSK